jgi:hypothetical protein
MTYPIKASGYFDDLVAPVDRPFGNLPFAWPWLLSGGGCHQFVSLIHPVSATRLVQIVHDGEHRFTGLSVIQFGFKQAALGFQYLDVAVVVAQPRVMGVARRLANR